MSNKPKLKPPGRNLQVLVGRVVAEAKPGTVSHVTVKHDDGCPGLEGQSMLLCRCAPEIEIEEQE
jgi:hypothetical protein